MSSVSKLGFISKVLFFYYIHKSIYGHETRSLTKLGSFALRLFIQDFNTQIAGNSALMDIDLVFYI